MANIAQRASGKWQAKIRRTGFPDNSKTFERRVDAELWARAVEREMDIGAFVKRDDSERITFQNAADRYIKEILPSKKSVRQSISVLKLLCEHFGKFSLASLNAAMLSKYRDDRLKSVKPQTVVHELNMISRVYKAAIFDWGIAIPQGIPTAAVRKPKVANSRDRRLEPGEWELLRPRLAMCKSLVPLAIVEFAIETAARQSEILSLTWDDVDLKNCTAKVRGIDGKTTKNEDAFRPIPLSTKALQILSSQINKGEKSKKGEKVFKTTQAAFVQSWKYAVISARKTYLYDLLQAELDKQGIDGAAQVKALIYHKKAPLPIALKLLAKITDKESVLLDLHFHDLRHEATSRLAEKLQLHELMKVTGHKSSAMLARYYHPKISDLAKKLG